MRKKAPKPAIDLTNPTEAAHHARFSPEGIVVHVQRTNIVTGEAIGSKVEVIEFVDSIPEEPPLLPRDLVGEFKDFYAEKVVRTPPMSAREAAAEALKNWKPS